MNLIYKIDASEISFDIRGCIKSGENEILLDNEINLLDKSNFKTAGYTINQLFTDREFNQIRKFISRKLEQALRNICNKKVAFFNPINYHHYISDSEHIQMVKILNNSWSIEDFPVNFKIIENRISSLLKQRVTTRIRHLNRHNEEYRNMLLKIKSRKISVYNIRIVRPQKFLDCNPPHKDVWINRLKNGINIYIPLWGSTENSSLPLIPSSHLVGENKIERTLGKYLIKNRQYTVPVAISINKSPLHLVRPNPKPKEAMIFSPYLIHGGAYNFEEDITRISLECRFWLK